MSGSVKLLFVEPWTDDDDGEVRKMDGHVGILSDQSSSRRTSEGILVEKGVSWKESKKGVGLEKKRKKHGYIQSLRGIAGQRC